MKVTLTICTPCGAEKVVHEGVRPFLVLDDENHEAILDLCPAHAKDLRAYLLNEYGITMNGASAAATGEPPPKQHRHKRRTKERTRLSPGEGERLLLRALSVRKRPIKPGKLARVLGMTPQAIYNHAMQARKQGLIESMGKTSGKTWTLTAEGRRRVEDRASGDRTT